MNAPRCVWLFELIIKNIEINLRVFLTKKHKNRLETRLTLAVTRYLAHSELEKPVNGSRHSLIGSQQSTQRLYVNDD